MRQKVGTQLTDGESFLRFFNKESFLFLVRYGVVSDAGVKKVMRPHQFHALRACRDRLADKASGVIWHSQGSGKSLTMVWLANYIRSNFSDPRVLIRTLYMTPVMLLPEIVLQRMLSISMNRLMVCICYRHQSTQMMKFHHRL